MKTKVMTAVAAIVLAGFLVSGCVPDTPPATTPTPTTTPTASPTTPTPEPTTSPSKPAISDLIVSAAGISELVIGGNAEALAESTEMIAWDAEFCVRPDGETTETEPGRWLPNYPDGATFYGDSNLIFMLDSAGGAIKRIDIFSTEIADENGLSIGSTLAEFQAAYPGVTVAFDGPMSDVYLIEEPQGTLAFEITRPDEGVTYWPADQQNKVFQIRVLAAGVDAHFATAASGNIAGVCSGI